MNLRNRYMSGNAKIPLYAEDIGELLDTIILKLSTPDSFSNADVSALRIVLKELNKRYEFVGNMPEEEIEKMREEREKQNRIERTRRAREIWAQEQEKMIREKAKRDNIISVAICLVALVITGINLALLML